MKLNGEYSSYEVHLEKNDNFVTLKYKLAEQVNKNPVNIILRDENDVLLDNNIYVPSGLNSIKYSLLTTSYNDIILKVWKNLYGVPKLIQVNPELSILDLIFIMMDIAKEHRELAVFNDGGERLSNDMLIKDCGLRNESVIKICAKSDVELSLTLSNLTIPDEESRSIMFQINDSIEDVKNKICHELPLTNDLTLFTDKDHLESGRRLIDYMVKKDDVIFYAELQRRDHIEIGGKIKKCQFSTTYKGKIIAKDRDIFLKRYDFNDILASQNREERIKFIKYDIITLARINIDDHPRFVHMETMFQIDNHFYIGLQLMNKSLKDCLPVTTEDDIFHIAIQTLEGLSYLHGMKIIYRSLKCSSILLDGDKNVKLTNFHFSKYLLDGNDQKRLNDATRSKAVDKNWAAPEMLGGNTYGLQADIWSYGATLIEMITEFPPYHGHNQSMVENKLLDKIEPAYKFPAVCPEWVENIIDMCLNWDPLLRPKVDDLIEIIRSVRDS